MRCIVKSSPVWLVAMGLFVGGSSAVFAQSGGGPRLWGGE